MTTAEASTDLAAALCRIALADAEIDEWLVQILLALLQPLSPDAARELVADKSSDRKAANIRALLALRRYRCSPIGAQHRPVEEVLRERKRLKEERDHVLHAFYREGEGDIGGLQRFRSRDPSIATSSVDEIDKLATALFEVRTELSAVLRQIEHQAADQSALGGTVAGLMEDCRELLAVGRIQEQGLLSRLADSLDREGEVWLALEGVGRWRITDPGSAPSKTSPTIARICRLDGSIRIWNEDGLLAEGCDTGWRDVTDLVRDEDPLARFVALRRVDGEVRYVQEGGGDGVDELIFGPDRLADRLFGQTNQAHHIPAPIRDLPGFRPQ